MNNRIDLSKLPILPNGDINSLVAIDRDGNIIVAQNNEGVTPNELNEILEDYALKGDIPNDVVTESELSNTLKDYALKGEIPSDVVTDSELSESLKGKQDKLISGLNLKTVNGNSLLGMGDITIISDGEGGSIDLSNYVTSEVLGLTLQNYPTKTEISEDLEAYQTKEELSEILSNYVTDDELLVQDFVTSEELNNIIPTVQNTGTSVTADDKKYIYKGTGDTDVVSGVYMNYWETAVDLMFKKWGTDSVGKHSIAEATSTTAGVMSCNMFNKLNNIPNDVATQAELANYQPKGDYLTSIPSEYITETELNDTLEDYVTDTDLTSTLENYQPKGDYLISIPSEYVTESELGNVLNDYVTETDLNTTLEDYQPKGNYLTSIPSEYVTEDELNNTLNNYQQKGDYVTNGELNTTLTNYQPKGEYLTSIPSEYVTDNELNTTLADYQPKGNYLTEVPSEYVTEDELTSKDYATKGELQTVDNKIPSIVSLTLAEYDALAVKDSKTLYIIID